MVKKGQFIYRADRLISACFKGGYEQFTASHGYETCWSDRMQADG
jgi:hypothetical protein